MKILAIKTNEGYLISDNIANKTYYSSCSFADCFFDNVRPERTFKSDWFKIKNKPIKIEKEVSVPTINQRYEIKPEYDKGTFKKVWLKSEFYDDDCNYVSEFDSIRGLYDYKEDKQPNIRQTVEFEWEEILEIEVFKEPSGFSYKASGQYDNSQQYNPVTERDLKYDVLSQILTPPILLHTQPCRLSSKETYDIIRKYVKENINPKVAEITSDYDFCFTVKKKIPLAKPYSYQTDVNSSIFGGRKKKPKYETRFVNSKSIEVFEMTHTQNQKGYQNYTPIAPFAAENQDAMKEYIDVYLETLINAINEPVCECDKCNGQGVLPNKTKQ